MMAAFACVGAGTNGQAAPPSRPTLMEIEHLIRYAPLAVGLMEIEHLIRYAPLAVGVNPSASQGEARLRGLERIISSKTISVGLIAQRALPRPHTGGCACGGTSPAGAGLRALSADVHVCAGVARPGGCACGGTSPAVPPDAEPSG